ncbi:pentapeptide repeat-containing protein [Streptomyces sp. NPDC003631]
MKLLQRRTGEGKIVSVTINPPGPRGCTHPFCEGAVIPARLHCLEHATDSERNFAMTAITMGFIHDFSGVKFTADLFAAVRSASRLSLEAAQFEEAVFDAGADFSRFEFMGATSFKRARFGGVADFSGTRFRGGEVSFEGAQFEDACIFDGAAFSWNGATFPSHTVDPQAKSADFTRIKCKGEASFQKLWVAQNWILTGAEIEGSLSGTAWCGGSMLLHKATLTKSVKLELDAAEVDCQAVTFGGQMALQLRNARLLLNDATLSAKSSVVYDEKRLQLPRSLPMPRGLAKPKLTGLRHVDTSHLMLIDLDLGSCHFADARNLDQLYHSGCEFEKPPRLSWAMGVIPIRPVRRDVLADERSPEVGRSTVASLYRQLRKGREDGKDEAGASGFYYGEMEMRRRRGARHTTTTERWILHSYWLMSGYGLRAMRALGWLLTAITATIILMMGAGLPNADPDQTVTGNMPPAGGQVELQVKIPDAKLTVPIRSRFTKKRANSALKVVLNSVVFRSSGQNLTTWGTYVEMASRFTEPLLLVLAGLAIHGRVKRG